MMRAEEAARAMQVQPNARSEPVPAAERASILIVDDAAEARELYAEYLEFCGFQVKTAPDGMQALLIAQQSAPDIIVMDLCMPILDGWQAIRELKAHPPTANIPIIAISAHHGEAAVRARDAGAEVCLAKPCLPSQLARAIRALLVWRRSAEL
jgi:CheY-like chemotaxis protein